MLPFDFTKFLLEKRLSKYDLSKILKIPDPTVYIMIKRGTIKPSLLKQLEKIFNEDLTKYIMISKINSTSKLTR